VAIEKAVADLGSRHDFRLTKRGRRRPRSPQTA
jgi:hypothetical protein